MKNNSDLQRVCKILTEENNSLKKKVERLEKINREHSLSLRLFKKEFNNQSKILNEFINSAYKIQKEEGVLK